MIPFTDYVKDGGDIYVAVHAKYADRVNAIAQSIPPALTDLENFRLMFMVFGDRLELLCLCSSSAIDDLPGVVATMLSDVHDSGNALDPVIGMVLSDHSAISDRAVLFLFSDGNINTHWYIGILTQVMRVIWLNEATSEALLTPFGERIEVVLDQ